MMGPSKNHTQEQAWLHAARSGQQRAFRALFEAHVDSLFRFLQRFSTDRAEAQDWVQRAFIKAFAKLDQFDGRSSFATWLFRIGLNEMWKDQRRTKPIQMQWNSDVLENHAEEPLDEFLWEHTMHDWLKALDVTKRSVFILHEVEGFAHNEIGQILDITESHSRAVLARVRKHLREQWKKENMRQ